MGQYLHLLGYMESNPAADFTGIQQRWLERNRVGLDDRRGDLGTPKGVTERYVNSIGISLEDLDDAMDHSAFVYEELEEDSTPVLEPDV